MSSRLALCGKKEGEPRLQPGLRKDGSVHGERLEAFDLERSHKLDRPGLAQTTQTRGADDACQPAGEQGFDKAVREATQLTSIVKNGKGHPGINQVILLLVGLFLVGFGWSEFKTLPPLQPV